MDMSEFNKSDFPQLSATVSKVLGEEGAEKELNLAWDNYGEDITEWTDWPIPLATFIWDETPQGWDFWMKVNKGIHPHE